MGRRIVRIGMLVVLLITVAVGAKAWAKSSSPKSQTQTSQTPKPSQTTQPIQWLHDLQTARRASVATGRPMLMLFGASYCSYCKKLDAEVFANPTVSRYINKSCIPVHLDFEKNKRI